MTICDQEYVERLLAAEPEERRQIILNMTQDDLLRLDRAFEIWAHRAQLPPPGEGWRVWLMMAGRGFGKTRAGAEWVHGIAAARPGIRVALVGASIRDARSIMVEGVSGLLNVAANHDRPRVAWEPSIGRLRWPNGSEAHLFSGDNADGLRGPEHDLAWADELAKWREGDAAWDNLQVLDDRHVFGRVRYMSGANCGVVTVILSVNSSVIQVRDLPRAPIESGCRIEVREGCDKRFQTCVSRFNNAVNFRGEPHLPGNDLLTRYPGA